MNVRVLNVCMYVRVFIFFVADWMSDLRLSSGEIVLKSISVTGMPNIHTRTTLLL